MPRTLRLPDGRSVQVPDDVTDAEIDSIAQQLENESAITPEPAGAMEGSIGGAAVSRSGPPIPFDEPVAPQPEPEISQTFRDLALGTQGVGLGLAEVAGAPVDLTTAILNLVPAGAEAAANVFLPDESEISLPRITDPIGGSEGIARRMGGVAEEAGFPLREHETLTPRERLFFNIDRLGAGAVGFGGAAAPLAQTSRVARALAPKDLGGALVDLVAGGGAGAGLTGAEVLAPDNPIVALPAMLAGGLVGAKGAQAILAPRAVPAAVARRFPERDIAPDPETGRGVSRRTADEAAQVAQARASDPELAAETIRQRAGEARLLEEPVPTSGIASGDIGMTALERGARQRSPVRFQESDEALRQEAQEKVIGLRDPEARPEAARELVETEVAARRSAARQPAERAQQELETLRAENTRLAAELETKRADTLIRQEQGIAEQRVTKEAAEESERALGGEVAGRAGGEVAASEQIAAAVADAKAIEEATKAGLYERATELGKRTPVVTENLAVNARAIKKEIGPLAQQDPALNNILSDLDNLASSSGGMTVADLIELRPRLSAARAASTRLLRGGVSKRLSQINAGIKTTLDDLAAEGDEASKAFQVAERNFVENFAPKFRQGVGRELDVAERAGRPVPPSAVGAKFLKPGAGGKEAAEDFRRILKGEGIDEARDFVLADMAKVIGSDGKINPNRLRTWIDSREGLFQSQPLLRFEAKRVLRDVVNRRAATTKLQKELERSVAKRRGTAVSLQKKINQVKADSKLSETQKKSKIAKLERNVAEVEREIQTSATSLLLNADPAVAVRKVFSAKDPRGAMREIAGKLRKDPEAAAGWKRAVVDHLVDRVTGTNTALTGGATEGPVAVGRLQDFFSKNERALAQVFKPEEMNALRRSHKILEPLGNLSRQATVGAQTAENKQLFNSIEAGLLAVTGNAITAGMIMKRVRVVLSLLPQQRKTVRLVEQMFFDPDLAALLLERNVNKIAAPAWTKKLTVLLATEQTAATSVQGDDEDDEGEDE